MTVKITKPALNLREELADLRKPSGIAGEALLRADSVQEQRDLIGAGRKNLIINGGFDVWQRGTSGSGFGYVSADRWKLNTFTAGTISLSQRTDAVGQSFTDYARFEQSVVDTSSGSQGIFQYIEGMYAVGKTVTVSFKAKASKALSNCRVRGVFALQTYALTTEWQEFSFTGTCVATGTNVRLMLDFGAANDLWHVDIAEVQLELGSVATDFEHRSYGEELALCQRYYQKGNSSDFHRAFQYHPSYKGVEYTFPVEMRTTPTASYTSVGNTTIAHHLTSRSLSRYLSSATGDNTSNYIHSLTLDAEL